MRFSFALSAESLMKTECCLNPYHGWAKADGSVIACDS